MTAVAHEDPPAGVMMVFQRAMYGLSTLSAGGQPTDDHRHAWNELANLMEVAINELPATLTANAILRARRFRAPQVVKRLTSILEESAAEPGEVLRLAAALRALTEGEALAPGAAWGLTVLAINLRKILFSEARRVAQ